MWKYHHVIAGIAAQHVYIIQSSNNETLPDTYASIELMKQTYYKYTVTGQDGMYN
jgi:hypothetical protein